MVMKSVIYHLSKETFLTRQTHSRTQPNKVGRCQEKGEPLSGFVTEI